MENLPIQKSNSFIIQRVTELLGDFLLEISRFGKPEIPMIWIAGPKIAEVAKLLKEDPDLGLNWLEHLSVAELDEVLVMSYFVRSASSQYEVVLRVSEIPGQISPMPSITATWPMGGPMELEIEELFGIHFDSCQNPLLDSNLDPIKQHRLLPEDWEGYPLRKTFKFPDRIQSIDHQRNSEEKS